MWSISNFDKTSFTLKVHNEAVAQRYDWWLILAELKKLWIFRRISLCSLSFIYNFIQKNCICKAAHDLKMVNFFIKHSHLLNREYTTILTWKCTRQELILAKSLSVLEAAHLKIVKIMGLFPWKRKEVKKSHFA